MIKLLFKTAFRNIRKDLYQTILNIFGLALGFRSLARKVTKSGMQAMADVNSAIKETVSGIAIAKNFRQENSIFETFNTSNQTSYMSSLIGKTVKANRSDGTVLEGVVTGAVLEKDNPQLQIGDQTVALSDVIQINGGTV